MKDKPPLDLHAEERDGSPSEASQIMDAVSPAADPAPSRRSQPQQIPAGWDDDQGRKKAFLRERLISFQLRISALHTALQEQENRFREREAGLFFGLFEVLDALEHIEESARSREGELNKAGQRPARDVRSVHRKVLGLLKAHGVVTMEFGDGRASKERCRVVDTRPSPSREDGTILSVVKNGFIRTEDEAVLRKAEVIVVSNASDDQGSAGLAAS